LIPTVRRVHGQFAIPRIPVRRRGRVSASEFTAGGDERR